MVLGGHPGGVEDLDAGDDLEYLDDPVTHKDNDKTNYSTGETCLAFLLGFGIAATGDHGKTCTQGNEEEDEARDNEDVGKYFGDKGAGCVKHASDGFSLVEFESIGEAKASVSVRSKSKK